MGERARAQTAADAAALAGAARGRPAAVAMARENHGDLASFAVEGAEVEVTVRVGDGHGHVEGQTGVVTACGRGPPAVRR